MSKLPFLRSDAPLIIVLSCSAYRDCRQRAVRETWAARLPEGWRILYLEGDADALKARQEGDRLVLPVAETYADQAERMHHFYRLYRDTAPPVRLLKVDDDTYLRPDRLDELLTLPGDYCGAVPEVSFVRDGVYAQGGAYALRPPAVDALAHFDWPRGHGQRWWLGQTRLKNMQTGEWRGPISIEDMMVGDILRAAGVELAPDDRFGQRPWPSPYTKDLFTVHPATPEQMHRIERQARWLAEGRGRGLLRCSRWWPLSP